MWVLRCRSLILLFLVTLADGACLVEFRLPPQEDGGWCGNHRIDPGERCDQDDLGGETCTSQGYLGGTLACSSDCASYDFGGCEGDVGCGDGLVQGDEACDDGNDVDWDGCTQCQISEIQVNPEGAGQQQQPDVAVSPAGDLVAVVWTAGQISGGTAVWLRLFDDQGIPLTGEVRVSDTEAEHAAASVGIDDRGIVTVVFQCAGDRDGSGWGIYLQRFSREGSRLLPEDVQLNTQAMSNQQYPRISVTPTGQAAVVWDHWNGTTGQHEVMFLLLDETGASQGNEETVYGNGDQDPTMPVVALGELGDALVAWQGDAGVYESWFTENGTFTPSERLDDPTAYPGIHSRPSVLLAEGYGSTIGVVVWQHETPSADNATSSSSILGLAVSPDGVLPIGDLRIDGTDTASLKFPVALSSRDIGSADSRMWVLWSQSGSGVTRDFFQRISSFGEPAGSPLPLSQSAQYAQGHPRGAMLPSGGFVAVWRASDQDGNSTGVFLQRFSPEGVHFGTQP